MEILKDGGLIDEIMLSFRYAFDDEDFFNVVINELEKSKIPFESYLPSKRANTYRIIIDEIQSDFFDPSLIVEINSKHNIPKNSYDFFLGITSRFEIGGFSVPQKVVSSICIIGGKVEISYACS